MTPARLLILLSLINLPIFHTAFSGGGKRPTVDYHSWIRSATGQHNLDDASCKKIARGYLGIEDEDSGEEDDVSVEEAIDSENESEDEEDESSEDSSDGSSTPSSSEEEEDVIEFPWFGSDFAQRKMNHALRRYRYKDANGNERNITVPDDVVKGGVRAFFFWCAVNGYTIAYEEIQDKILNIDMVNEDGWTALHVAAANGRVGFMQALLDAGANIRATGPNNWNALHWAAATGNTAALEVLITHPNFEPDLINARTERGRTPLHLAGLNGHYDAIRLLLHNGATPDVREYTYLFTPAQLAESRNHEGMAFVLHNAENGILPELAEDQARQTAQITRALHETGPNNLITMYDVELVMEHTQTNGTTEREPTFVPNANVIIVAPARNNESS